MSDVWFQNATSLAVQIKTRQISSRALLDLFLSRVDKYNGTINAVVWRDDVASRCRADAADAALERGEDWGALHGVPMTVKECYDFVGSPTTLGNPSFKDNFPKKNSDAVQRLLDAGAIIFGKTNVPLHLSDWQTFNAIYGTTNNPWDLKRVPGGSSGGSAAALAAGLTCLEVGTDIGGSIRNPAHYCGVYGHKPTWGIVRTRGVLWPGQISEDDLNVIGPLARSADDLELALKVMAGADDQSAVGWTLNLPAPRKKTLKDFKVGVMLTDPNCMQDDELTVQLRHTIDALVAAGVQVVEGAKPNIDTREAFETFLLLLRSATGMHLSCEEFTIFCERADNATENDYSYASLVDRGVAMRHHDWLCLNEKRLKMLDIWNTWFEEFDLLLCPIAASTAPVHDQKGDRADRTIVVNTSQEPATNQLFWAGFPNMAFLPSTVAPAGLTMSGLPCGLQIVANRYRDLESIHFARLMADVVGGFKAPPNY